MRPTIVAFLASKIGVGFFVPDYDVLLALAVVLAFSLGMREAERTGVSTGRLLRAGLLTALAGWVAARLYVVATHPGDYAAHPLDILAPWKGGTGSTGLYLGGFVAAVCAARWQRLEVAKFLDCCVPGIAAGIGIGRVACFVNGCCYGLVTAVPWAVRFPEGSGPQFAQAAAGLIAPDEPSLPVHPVQLYEALYGLLLLLIWWRFRRTPMRPGVRFAALFVLYPVGRFFDEFLRGDPRARVAGLSLPQVFCLIAIVAASSFLVKTLWLGRQSNRLAPC